IFISIFSDGFHPCLIKFKSFRGYLKKRIEGIITTVQALAGAHPYASICTFKHFPDYHTPEIMPELFCSTIKKLQSAAISVVYTHPDITIAVIYKAQNTSW